MKPKGILFFHGPLTKARWRTLHRLRRTLDRRGLLEPRAPLMRLADRAALRYIPKTMELFRCNIAILLCDKTGPWLAEAQGLLAQPLFSFYEAE